MLLMLQTIILVPDDGLIPHISSASLYSLDQRINLWTNASWVKFILFIGQIHSVFYEMPLLKHKNFEMYRISICALISIIIKGDF